MAWSRVSTHLNFDKSPDADLLDDTWRGADGDFDACAAIELSDYASALLGVVL